MTRLKRTKILSFNAQVAVTADEIWAGLRGVEISHGPYIVSWSGYWGDLKVWGSSWAQAAAVIERVCGLAGIPWGPQAPGDLIVSTASDAGRYRPGRYAVKIRKGLAFVSTRQGSTGLPEYPFAKDPRADSLHTKSGNCSRPVKRYKLRIENA